MRPTHGAAALSLAVLLVGCGGGQDPGAGDDHAFCNALLALDGSPPPEAGGNRADELTELAELAPEDLRPEVLAIRDYHRDVYVEGDGVTDSLDEMPAEVQAAGDRIDAFATSECEGWEPMDG